MKQVLIVILAVVLFFGAVAITPNYIKSEKYGQFEYYIQPDNTVKIFNCTEDGNKVSVPLEIDGMLVSGIADKCIGYYEKDGKLVKKQDFLINGYYGTASQIYAEKEQFLFNCLHDYDIKVLKKSTYGIKGEQMLTCKCGFSKTEDTDYIKIPDVKINSLKANGEGVRIEWNTIDKINEYNVYRSIDGKNYELLASSISNYLIDYKSDSGKIKYYVTGIAGKNEGTKGVKPVSINYFKSPNLKIDSTKKGVLIKWDNVSKAQKYKIYKKDENGVFNLLFETDRKTTSYLDKDVKKHSEYFYSAVSVDKDGNESVKYDVGKSVVYGKRSKVVYLTFDDGPSKNTLKILKVLKRYNAKATFFVISTDKPQYMKTIVNDGHAIALHSYSHEYDEIYESDSAYYKDLNKISDLVKKQTGIESKIIRFPGGSSNTISAEYSDGIMSRLTYSVEQNGYKYFDWNVDSGDASAKNVSAQTIINNVKARSKGINRCVVLMHDTKYKNTTAEALDSICAYYKSQGYEFDVLSTNSVTCHQSVNN